jgi:hypothetical protein
MKIAIIGTRGIPNEYGGFEQFAEYFSVYATEQGHDVTVYCSSLHSYQEKQYKNVKLVHCYDAENRIGTAGQFIYDLNCILHTRKQPYDVILQLGYTSSSIWNFLFKKNTFITTNMDGMEWKRSKYNKLTQRFLMQAEKWAVQHSDLLIADSVAIQDYLQKKYNTSSFYAAYGANVQEHFNASLLDYFRVKPYEYNLLVARMEPENNIEMIIEAHLISGSVKPLLVVGNTKNKYGKYLQEKYQSKKIRFLQGIYYMETLRSLRHFSTIYFHGHSVGGTNPSLLEAMADGAFIAAHDNVFNRSVLLDNACFFKSKTELALLMIKEQPDREKFIQNNLIRIKNDFNWEEINKNILLQLSAIS